MLAELESISRPDPKNVKQYFTFTRSLRQFMHPADRAWLAGLKELFLGLPGATEADFEWLGGGMDFSGRALIGATIAEDLFETAPKLDLPVYVIQGRDDLSTRPRRRGPGSKPSRHRRNDSSSSKTRGTSPW